jgi:hypothetical protein
MGYFLTSRDHLWDGIYNFNLYRAVVSKKRSDMVNYKLVLEENADIEVNLKTV